MTRSQTASPPHAVGREPRTIEVAPHEHGPTRAVETSTHSSKGRMVPFSRAATTPHAEGPKRATCQIASTSLAPTRTTPECAEPLPYTRATPAIGCDERPLRHPTATTTPPPRRPSRVAKLPTRSGNECHFGLGKSPAMPTPPAFRSTSNVVSRVGPCLALPTPPPSPPRDARSSVEQHPKRIATRHRPGPGATRGRRRRIRAQPTRPTQRPLTHGPRPLHDHAS